MLEGFDEPAAALLNAMLDCGYYDLTTGYIDAPRLVFSLELALPSQGAAGIMATYPHMLHSRDHQQGLYAYRFKFRRSLFGVSLRVTSADTHFERSWRCSGDSIRGLFPAIHASIERFNQDYTEERRNGNFRSPFEGPSDHLEPGLPYSASLHHFLSDLYRRNGRLGRP